MASIQRVIPSEARAVRRDLDDIRRHVQRGDWLSLGDQGSDVAALQRRLSALGLYRGPASGRFDAGTDEALRAYQRQNHLVTDGALGPQTLGELRRDMRFVGDHFEPPATRGQAGSDVRRVEERLRQLGFDPGRVDGVYDARTDRAVRDYRRASPRLDDERRAITRRMETELARARQPAPPNPAAPPAGNPGQNTQQQYDHTPPRNDYGRVGFRGQTVNRRTRELVHRAEWLMANKYGHKGFKFELSQGSYEPGYGPSAGTHDRGGALDIRTRGRSERFRDDMVRALREAGFAAWERGNGHDTFAPHIHAVAIGDRELSPTAASQVREYFAGGDGLRGSLPDGDRDLGRHYPTWARRYR